MSIASPRKRLVMNSSHGEKPTNVKNIQVDCFPAVGPYGAESSFTVIGSTPNPGPAATRRGKLDRCSPGAGARAHGRIPGQKAINRSPATGAILSAAGPVGDPLGNPLGNPRRGRHMVCCSPRTVYSDCPVACCIGRSYVHVQDQRSRPRIRDVSPNAARSPQESASDRHCFEPGRGKIVACRSY